jgi:hypothetical protein
MPVRSRSRASPPATTRSPLVTLGAASRSRRRARSPAPSRTPKGTFRECSIFSII